MAYQSYFANNAPTYKKATPATSGGNRTGAGGKSGYQSYFGFNVQEAPSADKLASDRAAKSKQQAQQRQQQQKQQADAAAKAKSNTLLNKVGRAAKSVGEAAITSEKTAATGIARVLPGGTNDIKASQEGSAQAAKDAQFVKDKQKAGKIKAPQATKLLQSIASNANDASKEQTKTVKALPSKGQVAAGIVGTGADILTAGTFERAKQGATLLKAGNKAKDASKVTKAVKVAKKEAPLLAGNATAGGLNAAAGGGTKEDVAKNALLGAALPEALHAAGTAAANGLARAGEKLSTKPAKELIKNTKTQSLLSKAPPEINAKVNAEHVKQGLVNPEVSKISIKNIALDASTTSKIDNAKVKQYEKQIKDGEPIEPIVTHKVNGQTFVVDGEHRLQAAKNLGITEVPTVEKVPGALPTSGTEVPVIPKVVPDSATVKEQIVKIKNDEKSYDANGNITPEAGKQITTLNKQLNANGERVPKVDKPVTVTPISEPVVKQPEIGQSKLAASTEQKAIDKKLTSGFDGRPEYAKVNVKDQAAAAHELHKVNPAQAERIALGKELPPEGLLPESVYIAVENHAVKTSNIDLLRKLATESSLSSEATGMGQRIRMLGERDPDSAVTAIRKVAEVRKKALEKRLGKTADKAVSNEIKAIRIAKPKVKKETWNDFVESIKC